MSDYFATPDDLGDLHASELHASLGESLAAQASNAFMGSTRTLYRAAQYLGAESSAPQFNAAGGGMGEGAGFVDPALVTAPASADVPIADAQQEVRGAGLDHVVKLPDQPTIRRQVLDMMLADAREQTQYAAAVNRGPHGFIPGALGFATQIGAGLIDPVGLAAFSIPVLGEARMGALLASAGESVLGRAALRAGIGAAQGAAGGALLAPADWWLHTQDGQDYTMADALRSVVLSAGMGAAFHGGSGLFGDVLARLRGRPLEGAPPIGGTHLPEEALAPEGAAADLEDVPGISMASRSEPALEGELDVSHTRSDLEGEILRLQAERDRAEADRAAADPNSPDYEHWASYIDGLEAEQQELYVELNDHYARSGTPSATDDIIDIPQSAALPHPADVLADLPERAREDVTRAAIADVVNGEPVRAGQLLLEAAKADPRIAESVDPYFEASTLPNEPAAEQGNLVRVQPPAARGPRARPEESWSLLEFLASRGGIDPNDHLIADLRGSIGKGNKFIPGFGHLIRKGGMSLDRAREAAVEAGYLQDEGFHGAGQSTTTPAALLEAMDAELRGNRVYRHGRTPESAAERERLADAEKHARESAEGDLAQALRESGEDIDKMPAARRERVVELLLRDQRLHPLDALERAAMEEDLHGSEAGDLQPEPGKIPGWDVEDSGPTPDAGSAAAGPGDAAGRPGGGGPRASGADDGSLRRGAPDWRRLARRNADDPGLIEASREADRAEAPSAETPERAVSAAEAAAADADKLLADILPTLTDEERKVFEDTLDQLAHDKTAREAMLRDSAACLMAAGAGEAAA